MQRVAQAARELRGERGLGLERAGARLQQGGVDQRQQTASRSAASRRVRPSATWAALQKAATPRMMSRGARSSQPFQRMITQLLTDIASSRKPDTCG